MLKTIQETDFEKVKEWTNAVFIDGDLIMLEHLCEAPFPKDARRMTFIVLGLCTHGSASYTMDGVQQTVTPGHIVLVSERHMIENYQASADFEGLCMMVSVPFYKDVMRSVSDISAMYLFAHNHPNIELSEREQQVFSNYFHIIKSKIGDTDNRFRRDLIRTLMLAMFYDLSNVIYRSRQVTNVRRSRADIIFTQFIKLVEENCKHERRVSWYAQQLNITPKYLSEMVKNISRRTPNEWIDNYVTLEIRVMLRNSTASIKDIAESLNFANQSFLGKYFKEHVGMSPSEYRKQ